MGFKTKIDYSNNRQIKQHLETTTALSGGTIFGTTFANMTKGPNLATSGETETYDNVASTFSGNNTTTIYTWYDTRMSIGEPQLSALTPSISAETQTVLPVFAPSASITIDGNVVNTAFTGVTFDITPIIMVDLGGGNYSGTVETVTLDVLSADTAEYTGRTIWVDTEGITRTERLIVTNNPVIGNVLTCIDSEGMASWSPAATGSSGFDVFVTGGTYNAGTATFTNNTGGTFNVTGFSTGGTGTSYWSAGTGTNAIATINGNNIASGNDSIAMGSNTIASGNYSHAEGRFSQAIGVASHAEGFGGYASGDYSHVEGNGSNAHGIASHAGGSSIASGNYSFVHGNNSQANGNTTIVLGSNITGTTDDTTYVDFLNIKSIPTGTPINNLGYDALGNVIVGTTGGGGTNFWSASTGTNAIGVINFGGTASGDYGITMGWQSTASGAMSLAQNSGTTASGTASYAEGSFTIAGGDGSHAEGGYTRAYGYHSHTEGYGTVAYGEFTHAEGSATVASGHSSHAQGTFTFAGGNDSHSMGFRTSAFTTCSVSSGIETIANGEASFVHGSGSTVNGNYSIVLGRFITGNTADTTYVDNLNIKTIPGGPGTIDLGVNAGGFVVNQASDERLKENIETIPNALEAVMNLRGVSYNWKDRLNGGNDVRFGFIAQEVQEVVPELVTQNGEYLGVQYKDVPALLVEAIKELATGKTEYGNTYLKTQTIQAEDNNIELNFNGTLASSIGGGIIINRGSEEPTTLSLDADGNFVSNVNILSKGFVIPEYTPTSSQDNSGVVGNITQDDNYIYIKRNGGWKRTPKLEDF